MAIRISMQFYGIENLLKENFSVGNTLVVFLFCMHLRNGTQAVPYIFM